LQPKKTEKNLRTHNDPIMLAKNKISRIKHKIYYKTQSRKSFKTANMCTQHTHNRFTALLEFVRDYPGEQVPER